MKKPRIINQKLFREFFESEKSGGIILIFCTIFSLLITNSVFGASYHHFWQHHIFGLSVEQWVNDLLMTVFFFLIGLELEREVYIGELSNIKSAMLPVLAACGGVIIPASIYTFFNYGTSTQSGAGIPMATDIAFALGILSLLGKRVPLSLKIFLTALAVIDDLMAILVIAFFYTETLSWVYLLLALAVYGILLIFNRLKIQTFWIYLLGGIFMWFFMLRSGVHATIAGVLFAFALPFGDGGKKSISYKIQHILHKPVAFIILPIFALANTAVDLKISIHEALTQHYALGIALGLILGKPIGIFLFSYFSVKFKWCKLPDDLNWKTMISVGFLGGIGFTMSIFITLLAFDDATIINNSKLMILISSLIAGTVGYILLKINLKETY